MDTAIDRLERSPLRAERLEQHHLAAIAHLLADPRVGVTLGGVRSEEEARAILDRHVAHWSENGFGYWAFFDVETGGFVGRGGLERKNVGGSDEVEVGWAVAPAAWNKGIATEIGRLSIEVAFSHLGLTELVSFTLVENAASRRVMEKCGFVYERDVDYKGMPHVLYRLRA